MNRPDNQTESTPNGALGRSFWAIALLAITVLGLGLRLYRLGEESIDLEEYVSACHLDAPDLIAFIKEVKDHYPYGAPLAFVVEYAWVRVVGTDLPRVRLLFVIAGTLVIPLLYLYARALYGPGMGRRAGLLAAVCVALSPVHVFHSQEARMYAFLVLLALVSAYSFAQAVGALPERTRQRALWWAVNVLANLCVIWTHLFGVLLLFAEGLFLLAFHRKDLRTALPWFTIHFLFCIPLALWVVTIPEQPDTLYGYYYRVNLRFLFWDLLGDDVVCVTTGLPIASRAWEFLPSFLAERIVAAHVWLDKAFLLMSGVAVGWVVWRLTWGKWCVRGSEPCAYTGPDFRQGVFLLMWFAVPVLVLAVLSLTWRRCYSQRFTMYTSLASYVMIGGAVASIAGRRWRRLATGAVVLLCAYQLSLLIPGPVRTDWRAAAEYIEANAAPGDVVLVQNPFWLRIFVFNTHDYPLPVSAPCTNDVLAEQTAFLLNGAAEESDGGASRSVWVVLMGRSYEFERRAHAHGFAPMLRDFSGARSMTVYRVKKDPAGEPSAHETAKAPPAADFFPNAGVLAKAIAAQSRHPGLVAYWTAIEMDADPWSAYVRLGIALAEKGSAGLAAAAFRDAVRLNPRCAIELADLQAALVGEGDYAGMTDAALAALASNPGDTRGVASLFSALRARAEQDRVIDLARRVIEVQPDCALAFSYLGMALESQGDTNGAIDAFRKALELDPRQDAAIYIALGGLYRAAGNAEDACTVLRRGVKEHPEVAWLHAHLGTALIEKGEHDAGISAMQNAVKLDPPDPNIWGILGAQLIEDATYEEAIHILNRAAELDPDNPRRHWILARALMGRGDEAAARKAIGKALSLDAQFAERWQPLITALYETKDYATARAEAHKLRDKGEAVPLELMQKIDRESGKRE